MLQGDIHRFYLTLRRHWPIPPSAPLDELNSVRAIADYYAQIDPRERHLLLCWAKKEESGIGMIPAALSGIPLIALIFAPLIQELLKDLYPWIWITVWFAGALAFTMGIYVHQRQKAYTTLHVQILEQLSQSSASTKPQAEQTTSSTGFTLGTQ